LKECNTGEAEFQDGTLPAWLVSARFRRPVPVLVVEAIFRTTPDQARGGGFHHRGRVDITLTSYALREDELRLLQAEREREDLRWMVGAVGIMDDRALASLEEELNRLARPPDKAAPLASQDTNPFAALWGALKSLVQGSHPEDQETTALPQGLLKRDSFAEQVLRSEALVLARKGCREVFRLLKTQLNVEAPDPREPLERWSDYGPPTAPRSWTRETSSC
jgi:hypothetical protein